MGIAKLLHDKNLGIKHLPKVYERIDDMYLHTKGKIVGIDASILLTKMVKTQQYAKDYVCNRWSGLLAEIERRIRLLRAGTAIPKFVFDGLNQNGKGNEQATREGIRLKAQKEINQAATFGSRVEISVYQAAAKPSEKFITAVKELLNQMRVYYVVAPIQADPQLVWMQLHNHIDFAWSTDTDFVVHGATRVIVDWDWWNSRCGHLVQSVNLFNNEETELTVLLKEHGLPLLQLLSVCDSDYMKLHSIGVTKWVRIIKAVAAKGNAITVDTFVEELKDTVGTAGFRDETLSVQVNDSEFF